MAEPNPLAILPIKSFEEAKQRLGEALDRTTRRVLAEAMFTDVLIALRRCTLVDVVLVVTSDHGAQRIAAGYGAMVLEDEQQGHNEAAAPRRRPRARARRRASPAGPGRLPAA